MDRGRLIVLRTALEKFVRSRQPMGGDVKYNQLSQDLADILDLLIDLENDREYWKDRAAH